MRTIIRVLIAIATITILVSWGKPLSTRMNDLIQKIERNHMNWTQEDWDRAEEEYKQLLQEYKQNYDSYSTAEKAAINKAIGRYKGFLVKQEIDGAGQKIMDFGERLPSLIEGFMSVFEE